MEASQLFLGSSSGAGTQALVENAPVQNASKQTDASVSFLALIKAGLMSRTVPTEPLQEASITNEADITSTESIEASSELSAEMLQSLAQQPDPELLVSQAPDTQALDVPAMPQANSSLLETLFSQNLVQSELLQSADVSLKTNPDVTVQQSQTSPVQALKLQLDVSSLSGLDTNQISALSVKTANQNSHGNLVQTDESLESDLENLPVSKSSQLPVSDLKASVSGADSSNTTAQVKQSQFDYWQNLFRTVTQSAVNQPAETSDAQAPTNQQNMSLPSLLSGLVNNLDTSQQNLTQLVSQLQPFFNQQSLSFATALRTASWQSDSVLKQPLATQDAQPPVPILTADTANLSLETQDFNRQQENNGFWPRASELGFATQTRSESNAELAQTKTAAALNELGERFALVKQLSQRIQLLNQRDRSIELALEPAHLGKLTLRLQQSAQQLNLQIFTELPLAKDLIESHLQQLRNQLQAQGFDVQHIQVQLQPDKQFSHNSSSGQQQESQQTPASSAFDLFQSEEIASEAEPESEVAQVDTKFNYQINTLV